jgi:hypothetical protein
MVSPLAHTSTTRKYELQVRNVPEDPEDSGELERKRKGHPAKGGLFFQGRIVPTEIQPSKLSGEIL